MKYEKNFSNLDVQSTPTASSPNKSQNTNLWTIEEQKRLEELLNRFPPEPIESNRFKKIASVLGTRSEKQVASRVQKFFKKLHEANLPIPGTSRQIHNRNIKKQKHNLRLERPTTFFPERNIPRDLILKDDKDDDHVFAMRDIKEDDDAKTVQLLKQIKAEKLKFNSTKQYSETPKFKCSTCKELLFSQKFSCKDCDLDFCSDCIITLLLSSKFVHLNHNIQ